MPRGKKGSVGGDSQKKEHTGENKVLSQGGEVTFFGDGGRSSGRRGGLKKKARKRKQRESVQ